jgi:hypothetical protein
MHILAFHKDKAVLLKKEGKSVQVVSLDVNPQGLTQPPSRIVTAIDASDLLLRELSFSLKSKKAIEKVLPFQIESSIPFPLNEAIVCPYYQKTASQNDTSVTLFAIKKKQLEQHLEEVKLFDICPDQVSCTPIALYRYAQFVAPKIPDLVLFHISEEKSTYIAIASNKLILSQTISMGRLHAHTLLPHFKRELQRVVAYLSQKGSFSHLILTGDLTPEIEEAIKNSFDALSLVPNPHSTHAIPFGLCLDGNIQFLNELYETPRQKRRKSKRLISYLFASCALFLLIGGGGAWGVNKREKSLFNRVPQEHLGEKNLAAAINAWDKRLKSQKNLPPVSIPLVSDFLAWLSSHPQAAGINIQKVDYKLTKFPRLGHEQEPYEASVEIHFNASTPRHAQTFHELLNTQQNVIWTVEDNQYIASFILKQMLN